MTLDHPIFTKSLFYIRSKLTTPELDPLEKQVLERLIHSSGDFSIQGSLKFSPRACQIGISALKAGAPILTDTFMAAAAVKPMSSRTLNSSVHCVLNWAPEKADHGETRTALGMEKAWNDLSKQFNKDNAPIVLFGSAPTALNTFLRLTSASSFAPSLIIGMPVGFIGVIESKKLLSSIDLPQIRLDGNRGGAGMAAATVNALLRAAVNEN
ncbi:precorrin-8X methylmutase [Prochlorococcus marinus]|uniref:precorrin-8X methylmutase n=1 Tax=Prochlorococcus marinus TaxID=1219 RepID=UPI0022B48024|nr:precorrin-8X methylmutase [Prochlorococcus marinus]